MKSEITIASCTNMSQNILYCGICDSKHRHPPVYQVFSVSFSGQRIRVSNPDLDMDVSRGSGSILN